MFLDIDYGTKKFSVKIERAKISLTYVFLFCFLIKICFEFSSFQRIKRRGEKKKRKKSKVLDWEQ